MVKVIPCNTKELSAYNRALQELFQAVNNPPNRFDSDCSQVDSDDENSTSCPLLETEIHYTETDVTLPSSLAGSSGSCETEPTVGLAREKEVRAERPGNGASQRSSPVLCPSAMGQVNREMLHIYRQLQTEHLRQQKWAGQLQDRENKLLQQESRVKEARQLQDQLKERTRENKRLMASFNSIKEHNDTMKKQLNDLSEQNKHLENQFRKVQARLENLQRKYEYSMAQKGREDVCLKTTQSKPKAQTTATSKPAKVSRSSAPLRLQALLLDWVLDGQASPPVEGDSRTAPGQKPMSPGVSRHDRCSKALPLLVEQLQQSSTSSDPSVYLSLIRFICWSLTEIDRSSQRLALSSTLRRLGEVMSRGPTQQTGVPPHPPPLYRSPCPHTRILSSLIILRTITQADVVAQVLDSLHSDLVCVDVRGLFLRHGGMSVLLALLRCGKVGLQTSIDILLQLSGESRYQHEFLSACSTEDFFRMAALLVKKPRLELPLLEKLSIILQKLSKIRKNRRLFELCSLHLLLQEMHRSTDPTHTFLLINLSSILLNLNTHTL
ncbi:coiled-coil domain-containing protein 138 isoform X2 [Esox lucius]|nr:coiled-coil domain-containing protein 138 isoform X2 [Esox lucius]XP_019910122.1 coiled-coil domain-containing protein 138 isoform X2 [Esox lucius]